MYRIRAILGGWLIGLALMVLVPLVTGAQEGPEARQQAEATPTPRIWSGSPSMRLWGRGRQDPLPGSGAGQSRLAAMADGGYVLAGTVPGPAGREAWV
ncbi:MAG: hypothetical protein KAX64_04340, partial [Chromatiaceae bacterium]|nr:hypothetical protein [Chromatiaceae bacterium]